MRIEKSDAVAYYRAIAKTILPHLRNRPLSFKRFPGEIGEEFFWEKDAPGFTPAWVKRFPVPRREGGPPIDYVVCNDMRTLTWLASVGGIELHPFLHKVPKIDVATHAVFDLDPGQGADIRDCAKVAVLLRDMLPLASYAKVSGSKGIQVYVPLNSGATHEVTETFARLVAEEMARAYPKLVVAKMAKALRVGKVLIDWSQNADYKTTVAVYSLRATGLVSMPVRWRELSGALQWTPSAAIARVRKVGDLFAEVLKLKQQLPYGVRRPLPPLSNVAAKPRRGSSAAALESGGRAAALHTLPKPSSQSGRRLFVLTNNELWLEMGGRFKRFLLRANLAAISLGEVDIDPKYYRAEEPRGVDDRGAYEVVEGSWQSKRFELWFSGRVMSGPWSLEQTERTWRLTPR